MADETALLDRVDTGADLPSQELVAAETDGDDTAPETGAGDNETENEDAEDQVLTKADFDKRLKAELAKKDESYRQKLEHEKEVAAAKAERESFESRKKDADAVRNGRALQELSTYVQWALTNQQNIPVDWVRKTADSLAGMAFLDQHGAYVAQVDKFLKDEYPDFRVPRELASKAERAVTRIDPEAMVNAHQEILREAIRDAEREKIRKEVEAEFRKQAEDGELEEHDNRRASEPRPTRATGQGIGGGKPMVLTTAEINAYPSSRWMRDYSPEERQKVYANAEEADRKHGAGNVRAAVRARWGK